jgi:hypothetical protein
MLACIAVKVVCAREESVSDALVLIEGRAEEVRGLNALDLIVWYLVQEGVAVCVVGTRL